MGRPTIGVHLYMRQRPCPGFDSRFGPENTSATSVIIKSSTYTSLTSRLCDHVAQFQMGLGVGRAAGRRGGVPAAGVQAAQAQTAQEAAAPDARA